MTNIASASTGGPATSRVVASQDRGRGFVLAAASLGFAVIQLDVSVVNVAIKPIGAGLGGGVTGLQWVVDAYTVTFAALILVGGALADRFGGRRGFVAGFAWFTVMSMVCGAATSITMLVVARALQGIGAAALASCSLSLLAHAYPDAGARARAVGVWAMGASAALAAGPVAGGVLITTLGWRAIFFINAPIGMAGIALTLRHAARSPRDAGRGIDLYGQLAATVALGALAVASIEAGPRSITDPLVLGGLVIAAAGTAAFLAVEHRARRPMLPPDLLRTAAFALPIVVGLLVNVAFYGSVFVLSLFLQRHASPLATGVTFVPMMAAIMVANAVSNRLTHMFGRRGVLLVGAGTMAGGYLAMLTVSTATSTGMLLIPLTAQGFGLGLIVPVMTAALLGSVTTTRSGTASGALNAARQLGSMLGVALFGSLVARSGASFALHAAAVISTALVTVIAALAATQRKAWR